MKEGGKRRQRGKEEGERVVVGSFRVSCSRGLAAGGEGDALRRRNQVCGDEEEGDEGEEGLSQGRVRVRGVRLSRVRVCVWFAARCGTRDAVCCVCRGGGEWCCVVFRDGETKKRDVCKRFSRLFVHKASILREATQSRRINKEHPFPLPTP